MFFDLGTFLPNNLLRIHETFTSSCSQRVSTTLQSFDSPTLLFNTFFPSNPHIFNRGEIWMPPLSLYLGPVYCLIWFNLCQTYSWTRRHPALVHLNVWRSWGRFRVKTFGAYLRFSSHSLIISLENIFSVSTNISTASFYVFFYPPSLLFLALLTVLPLFIYTSNLFLLLVLLPYPSLVLCEIDKGWNVWHTESPNEINKSISKRSIYNQPPMWYQ